MATPNESPEDRDRALLISGDLRAASTLLKNAAQHASDPEMHAQLESIRTQLAMLLPKVLG